MSELSRSWLEFQINNETYIHSVDSIVEVMPYNEPSESTGTSEEIIGMLSIRGEIVSIMCGQKILQTGLGTPNPKGFIIIAESADAKVGITIDKVAQIKNFEPSMLDIQDSDTESPYIKGTVQQEDQLYIIVDFTSLADNRDEDEDYPD